MLQQTSHSDWVLDTVFTHKGDQLVSVGPRHEREAHRGRHAAFHRQHLARSRPARCAAACKAWRGIRSAMSSSSAARMACRRPIASCARSSGTSATTRSASANGPRWKAASTPWLSRRTGRRFAAGSSLDGKGAVNFYNYDFNTEMPADILAIESKDEGGRNDDEKKQARRALRQRRETARQRADRRGAVYALALSARRLRSRGGGRGWKGAHHQRRGCRRW